MKEILDDYSPILDGVEVNELTKEVKEKQHKLRLQPNLNKQEKTTETS